MENPTGSFFAVAIHKVLSAIDADDECLDLLFQAWFWDDVVLASIRRHQYCRLCLS